MVQNFVKIRKGTSPTYAFRKVLKYLWDYLLFDSRNMKLEHTITIRFEGGEIY